MLTALNERTRIELRNGVPQYTEDEGESWVVLDPDSYVSMNCWAFPAGTLNQFEALFCDFLDKCGSELKSEFYLPAAVNALVNAGEADVRVIPTKDKWYGMTYAADHAQVRSALADLTEQGVYPTNMWN